MFGIGKRKAAQVDTQVPYPVYETLNRPASERRVWIIRTIVALVVVTGLIIGGRALSQYLLSDDGEPAPGSQAEAQYGDGGNDKAQPSTDGTPAKNPATSGDSKAQTGEGSSSSNNSTVRKPE